MKDYKCVVPFSVKEILSSTVHSTNLHVPVVATFKNSCHSVSCICTWAANLACSFWVAVSISLGL